MSKEEYIVENEHLRALVKGYRENLGKLKEKYNEMAQAIKEGKYETTKSVIKK